MGRCIMVLGVPRSGTSCVSGVLHRLGIDMGEGHLQPADKNNQKGYYEDLRWAEMNKDIAGWYYVTKQPLDISNALKAQYRALVEKRDTQAIWGFKNVRGCFTAQFIWPYLEDVRLVLTSRDPEHSARSIKEHSRVSYGGQLYMRIEQARIYIDIYREALEHKLGLFKGPTHTVNYRRLVDTDKHKEIAALAKFCFEGLDIGPTPEQLEDAARSLYKDMDHYA